MAVARRTFAARGQVGLRWWRVWIVLSAQPTRWEESHVRMGGRRRRRRRRAEAPEAPAAAGRTGRRRRRRRKKPPAAGVVGWLTPEQWAEAQWGTAGLKDRRRTRRAVFVGAKLAAQPGASIPQQMDGDRAATRAAYDLFNREEVTHAALSGPHWEATRAAAGPQAVVLCVQDGTTLDYSAHPQTEGLGPIGNGRGRGLLLHTALAVLPTVGEVLGVLGQKVWARPPATAGETRAQRRRRRDRESQVWGETVEAMGPPPEGVCWVETADRGADYFAFWTTCRQQRHEVLVRLAQDRRVEAPPEADAAGQYLLGYARSLEALGSLVVDVPREHGRKARQARLQVSAGAVQVRAPQSEAAQEPYAGWVVRAWEGDPPEGEAGLEWILLTSLPTETWEAAVLRVQWYTRRWVVEEYHKCLKTGCRLEARQMQTRGGLEAVIGFLGLVAVRLLQLRDLARRAPETPVEAVVETAYVQALAARLGQAPVRTVGEFFAGVARLGGYLGQAKAGPPGWQTLWRGWQVLQTLVTGMRLRQRKRGRDPTSRKQMFT